VAGPAAGGPGQLVSMTGEQGCNLGLNCLRQTTLVRRCAEPRSADRTEGRKYLWAAHFLGYGVIRSKVASQRSASAAKRWPKNGTSNRGFARCAIRSSASA
jgi:hypothetical protein